MWVIIFRGMTMSVFNDEGVEERNFVAKKIYDPFLRFLHWWNALSIFSLMLSMWLKGYLKPYDNWKEILYHYHILIGYALTAGFFARIFWGIFGPTHAKFKNMFHWKDYIRLIKTRKFDHSPRWGHDRYAGIAYVILYLFVLYQAFSGLYLAAEKYQMGLLVNYVVYSKDKTPVGSTLKDIHEIVYYAMMGYVVLHIFMLIFLEIKNKYPLTQSMLSGFQYRKKGKK